MFQAPHANATTRVLTNDDLRRHAPAIFAEAPHSAMSERYTFIPTIKVIDAMRDAGWQPVRAMQSVARDESRWGLQRHMVRFRRPDAPPILQGVHPEVALMNAHDGTSAYVLMCALFRQVCSNGMIVQAADLGEVRVKHSGTQLDDVIEGSFTVIEHVPRIAQSIDSMRKVVLNGTEQQAFAESAAIVRWGSLDKAPVRPSALVNKVERVEDASADLWTVFNRVQEHVIKGGVRGQNASGRRHTVRPINSVSEDARINRALWHLAESMKTLKAAA